MSILDRRSSMYGFILTAALATANLPAYAEESHAFHIEAADTVRAIQQFGTQADIQILASAEQLKGKALHEVTGSYTTDTALRILLADSGLTHRYVGKRTVALVKESAAAEENTKSENTAPVADEARVDLGEVVVSVPEVLVRGSSSLNMDIRRTADDIQPYVVFGREVLERSGAPNIESFLKEKLSMDATFASPSQQASQFGNSSTISLRGLGANQTLILIDGHRTSSYSVSGTPQQPDLNGIPLAAVERIEVLPTTASGIYGGSATGGVINVVLRRDYHGVETKLTYADTFGGGGGEHRLDAAGGISFEGGKTNLLFAGSFSESQRLYVDERDVLQRGRERILANNPATFFGSTTPPLGATTNIRSANGAPLTLKNGNQSLDSAITYVPTGYAGESADGGAALVANAGQYNLALADTAQIGGGRAGLLNDPTVTSLMATIRREFPYGIRAFLDLGASNTTGYFATNQASSTFTVSSTAPNNPFNQDITVTTPAFGTDGLLTTTNRTRRAVAGVTFALPGGWRGGADYAWSRVRFSALTPGGISAAGSAAVRSGAIDVLRDTNSFPVDFSAFMTTPASLAPNVTSLRDATARAAGSIFNLPGGEVTASTAIEYRKEAVGDQLQTQAGATTSTLTPSRSQTVDSVYVELKFPLVSSANRIRWIRELELQLAGRRDHYATHGTSQVSSATPQLSNSASNDFSSTDPTVALRFRPLQWLMFRASYGTGFLAPAVNQLVPDAPRQISAAAAASLGITDPQRGGERLGAFTLRSGGNADLRPEQSTSRSAGFVITPAMTPDLRLSVDWIKIHKTDNITNFAITQDNVNGETLLPGYITRGAPGGGFSVGPITEIRTAAINAAQLTVEAFDFAVDYQRRTDHWGTFSFNLSGTRSVHNLRQDSEVAPVLENNGMSFALPWKSNASIDWGYRGWNVAWTARYYDSYWLNVGHTLIANQGSATVPGQIYHDVTMQYRFAPSNAILDGASVQLGIRNVFNKEPPFDATAAVSGTFYSALGDPRDASYYLSIGKRF